jgi:tRNA(Leu) C34 or U34 (ribose-2'-O)-methylase TrmL
VIRLGHLPTDTTVERRGYAVVALDNPKTPANVGSAMRAAQCYGAQLILIGGQRMQRLGSIATDTMKAYRHIPTMMVDDVMDHIPHDCVPVAVDLVGGARELPAYTHPERAFYIFGPEDGTLGKRVLDRCRDKVMVPTFGCMNLAACVNVILYDRMCKRATDK